MANTRQQPITIQSSQVPSDQTNFVVLITRDHLDNEVVDPSGGNAARTDGGDLRFYADSGRVTEYAREIVQFEHDSVSAAGDAVVEVWVKLSDTLTSASNKTIYVEYGDGTLTDYAVTATYGRNNVWSAYEGVWHCGDTVDSTGNGQSLTLNNGAVQNSDNIDFDGVNDSANAVLSSAITSAFTLQGKIRPDALNNNNDRVLGLAVNGSTSKRAFLGLDINGNNIRYNPNDGSTNVSLEIDAGLSAGQDWWIWAVEEGSTRDLYLNSATPVSSATSLNLTSASFGEIQLGDWIESSNPQDGKVYEARVRSGALSADWITTEYNNESSPATFATAGSPSGLGGGSVDDINTNEVVEDSEAGVTFTTSGYGGEITTATINDGTNSTSASNISSTGGAGTFDLPDVSGYASDTTGSPFTTASHTIQATLGDGTDTASLGVTYNPKTGWAVVEVASAVKTQGSVFENFVGTITDASQVLYPTSNNTSVSATGIITTDATQDIDMQFWDVTDGTWKPFTALIGSGNGGGQIQPVVSSFVLSMVSNTVK